MRNVRIRLTRRLPGANRRFRSTSTMAIITPSSRLTTATAVTTMTTAESVIHLPAVSDDGLGGGEPSEAQWIAHTLEHL